MQPLLRLLACLALLLSVGLGSVAHATEAGACITATEATAGHAAGDADQVPADADKAYPHHHGLCHGHHLAAPASDMTATGLARRALPATVRAPVAPASAATDPALRPPRA